MAKHAARSVPRQSALGGADPTNTFKRNPPQRLRPSLPLALTLAFLLPMLLTSCKDGDGSSSDPSNPTNPSDPDPRLPAEPGARRAISLRGFTPRFPADCEQTSALPSEQGGLCLLVSTKPGGSGEFYVRPVKERGTGAPQSGILVSPNLVLSLAPGAYEIFKSTGIDAQNPAKVTVRDGRVTRVKTMTLSVPSKPDWPYTTRTSTRTYKIQRFQALPGTNNGGCAAEFIKAGFHSYLPGNFVVVPTTDSEQSSPTCEIGGTTFNAVSGQGYTIGTQDIGAQFLSELETYVHRNGVSALTAMSPAMHGITRMGWLDLWRLHQGIANPDETAHPALAFYGPGNYTYIVPFRFRYNGKVCGVSLAQGGLPESDLLTDCTFAKSRLTGFKVNKGTYFTYHNLYGMSGISANAIGHGFEVENVNFKLPRGY
ncbi:hypothetical protein ThimaDRAFT_3557 [Thiocapsa marina 5811]|uniref:Uncharacterized protein n=1 Tax=Thiocapsa marina 5811 TaxID=768671 RepID=F9UF54_9GAMM|nr:hypothetical protein ThimaDRAFT_3557 [Thiocapsa marina 5811]